MKNHILPAIKMTLICLIVCVGAYSLLIWGIAKIVGPNKGTVAFAYASGKIVGVANVGQVFTYERYFWGRPSAVDYNAASSGGSNKGPSNPEYLQTVEDRIDTLLAQHPNLQRADIPSDMVTASGSGLDPHISPEAALVQASRVANARNLPVERVRELVLTNVNEPLLGLFGTATVNVLKLNIALDQL